ncbi:MAG: DUF2795 domain-containing protein [Archangiaceae bacterium]|nr:DUF2795 domain-containing protein [Archangiaceae bacterium]
MHLSGGVPRVVEQGDLFFAFRRRVGTARVHDLRDVQRFYLVLHPLQPRGPFRVFEVGRKHLPAPGAERGWAFNSFVGDADGLQEQLSGKDYPTKTRGLRHLPEAELAGEGAYRLLMRDDHASELVYALEQPEQLGPLQRELGIHAEGRLIVALRNPDLGRLGRSRGPGAELPGDVRARFGSHRWLPIDDPQLLEYPYAQIVLIAARGTPVHLDVGDGHTRRELERLLHKRVRRALDDEPTPRPPLRFLCPICAEGFETRSAFERHVEGAHPPRAPSAADLAKALSGAHFPATRDQLVERAVKRPSDPQVVELLRSLPADRFESVTDVTRALGELKSRIPG